MVIDFLPSTISQNLWRIWISPNINIQLINKSNNIFKSGVSGNKGHDFSTNHNIVVQNYTELIFIVEFLSEALNGVMSLLIAK